MKILLIITKAGLCNRLQEILSWCNYGLRNNYDKIYFIWYNTSHCNTENICDIIDNIPNVKILEANKKYTNFEKFIMEIVDNQSRYNCIKKVKFLDKLIEIKMVGGGGKHPDFKIINPKLVNFNSTIVKEVNEYIDTYLSGDYLAIHLRIQDNCLFIDYEFIDNLIEKYKNKTIYIATDSVDFQNKYKNKDNILFNRSINKGWHANRSDIRNAVFDMLICSKAKIFCGTPNKSCNTQSSYSNFIYGLRGVYEEAISEKLYNVHFIHYIN